MATKATQEAQDLLQRSLKELESSRGSVTTAVRLLLRAAVTIGDSNVEIWCNIQMGDVQYTLPLNNFGKALVTALNNVKDKKAQEALEKCSENVNGLKLVVDEHYSIEEINIKLDGSGGGYNNIGFIEERYADLVRIKRGSDGTYYKNNLNSHLNYVRKAAHARASRLYNRLAYADTPQTSFDVIKQAVDDKLLDLAPEQAEQLMLAFQAVSGNQPEAWSQALTTCRRLIQSLADLLMPPTEENIKGRALGEKQYINRLWAYMDGAVQSDSNRQLAKAHVDFLGTYIERAYKVTNKGVHAEVTQMEAVRTVFHIYLAIADLLEYVDKPATNQTGLLNINRATLDELESILNVSRETAKAIVKLRVQDGTISVETLDSIKGVGPKTVKRAQELFSFESLK